MLAAGAINGHNMVDVLKKEKSLPSVVSNSLGTLYEEPCVVYVRVGVLHRGGCVSCCTLGWVCFMLYIGVGVFHAVHRGGYMRFCKP